MFQAIVLTSPPGGPRLSEENYQLASNLRDSNLKFCLCFCFLNGISESYIRKSVFLPSSEETQSGGLGLKQGQLSLRKVWFLQPHPAHLLICHLPGH